MLRRAAALSIFWVACSGSPEDGDDTTVLRVSATAGLTKIVPGFLQSSSSAAAFDLVYEDASEYLEEVKVEARRVEMRVRPGSPYRAPDLASALRDPGLVSARPLAGDRIEAVFRDEESARMAIAAAALDLGPFAVDSEGPGRARLRRRSEETAIDVIEIEALSRADEWRKLMAREIDVMPYAADLYREQLAGIGSIRTTTIPPTISAALYFNVRHPALASATIRRRIAGAFRRAPIARIACGDPACAEKVAVVTEETRDAPLPPRLSIVSSDDSTFLLATSVLRHQLWQLGIAADIEAMTLEQLGSRLAGGDYQLAIGPLPKDERRYHSRTTAISGFVDPAYEAAVARRDFGAAEAILAREVPFTPLYEYRMFAAIDASFCGSVTPSATSWRWMADLVPCDNAGP